MKYAVLPQTGVVKIEEKPVPTIEDDKVHNGAYQPDIMQALWRPYRYGSGRCICRQRTDGKRLQ